MFINSLAVMLAILAAHVTYRRSGSGFFALVVGLSASMLTPMLINEAMARLPDVQVPVWPMLIVLVVVAVAGWVKWAEQAGKLGRHFPPRPTSDKHRRDD